MATIADVRSRARAIASQHRANPEALAHVAIATAAIDEQLAFELFRASKNAVLTLTPLQIESLLPRLHDWNSTDCFGCFVSGVAWREGILRDTTILKWTRSENRWTRRAALVSTVPLNLKARGATAAKGEAAKTLTICEKLIADRDDMVVKALSWALRTLAARDTQPVVAFIRAHESSLAPRALRETRNKLATGLKNPKR